MLKQPVLDDNAPWKERLRAAVVLNATLADAAPTCGLAVTRASGVYQLHAWDVPAGALRPLTAHPEGKLFGALAPDGRHVYYLEDAGGNEIGHYVRVPFEGGAPQDITPDLPPYATMGLAISRSGARLGFTVADAEGFHLYVMDMGPNGEPGTPRALWHGRRLAAGPALSADGAIAVMASTERSAKPQYSLVAIDVDSGAVLDDLWDGPETSIEPRMFSPVEGDPRLLAATNRSGVRRPLLWNPRSGERLDLELADMSGEMIPADWSSDGARLLLMHVNGAQQQLYTYDLTRGVLTRLAHPGGSFGGVFFAPDGEIFANWNDATHPNRVIALDGDSGALRRTVLAAGDVPLGRPWQSVTFPSSDGATIQAWLALPEGEGPFPTILHTHGGPTAVQLETFDPWAQAWLDHGFAFFSVNYRGSVTFGRDFQEKINGDLGHWEVEDMVAGRDWLVAQAIARPDQIFLTGWSYGGYLTLMGLGVRPDLWAGGMAGVAIADWAIQYEDTADTLKGYQVALLGGTPQTAAEQYRRSSPITYAEHVRAPVLVIQGRNDTRCPARPMVMYEEKLRALGTPIEVHWFDAGHVGPRAQVQESIEHQERMLRFVYRIFDDVRHSKKGDTML
ncbi:MAG: prolyl oligopeptidase family serine peptidase [Anaerolineae bacterium]